MSISRGESFIYQQKKNIYGKYGSEQPRKERNNRGGENALNNLDGKKKETIEAIKKKSDQTSVFLTEKNQVRSNGRTSFDEKLVRKREKEPKEKRTLELVPKSGGIYNGEKKHHKIKEDRANRKILDEKRSSAGTKVSQYLEEARKMVADAKGPRKGHSLRQAMSPRKFGVGQQENRNQMYPANYGQAVLPRNTYNSPMPQHSQYGMQQPISGLPPKDSDLFSSDQLVKNRFQDSIPPNIMDTRNLADHIPSQELARNRVVQDNVARDMMDSRNVLDHLLSDIPPRSFQQLQPFDPVEKRKEHELKLALLKRTKKKMKPITNFAVSEVDKLVCSRLDQQSDSQQPLKPLGSLISAKTPLGPIVDKPLNHTALHSDHMLPPSFGRPTNSFKDSRFSTLDIVEKSTPNSDTCTTNHTVLNDNISPNADSSQRSETPLDSVNNKSSISAVFQSDHMLPSSLGQPESNPCKEYVPKLEVPKNTTPEEDMGLGFTEIPTDINDPNINVYDSSSLNLHVMSDDDTVSAKSQEVTSERSLFKSSKPCIEADSVNVSNLASESSCKEAISFSAAQTQTIRADVVLVSTNTPQQISSSVATQIDTPCKNCSPCSASFGDSLSNQATTRSVATATVRSVGTQTDESCFCQAFPRSEVNGSVGERYEVVRRDQGRILLRRIYEKGDEPGMVDILRASYNVSGLIPIPPNRNSPYESLYNYIFDETSICDEHTSATTEGEDTVEPQVPFTKRKKSSTLSRMKSKFGVEPSSSERKRYKPSKPKQVEPLFEDNDRAALLERVRALFKRIRNRPKEDYYGIDLLSRVRR